MPLVGRRWQSPLAESSAAPLRFLTTWARHCSWGLQVRARWAELGIYQFDPRHHSQAYTVDTPPPTVSGRIHVGHVYSYTHADVMIRYHRMKGEQVFYPFGFDDNGLPTDRFTESVKGVRARDVVRAVEQHERMASDDFEPSRRSNRRKRVAREIGRHRRTDERFNRRQRDRGIVALVRAVQRDEHAGIRATRGSHRVRQRQGSQFQPGHLGGEPRRDSSQGHHAEHAWVRRGMARLGHEHGVRPSGRDARRNRQVS